MKYYNTRDKSQVVSCAEATVLGLGKDKGLFFPESIPTLCPNFFKDIETLSMTDIAFEVMKPFIGDDIADKKLRKILKEAINFVIPVQELNKEVGILELFHGPTQAFKDVGARFMSRCLAEFTKDKGHVRVLVATSGDTGSAVAHGFYNVDGVDVKVLFPKGKVSAYQEFQMTSLGKNIKVLEVDGTFDDCQALVKQAFNDADLNAYMQLSSANSINVARFLPQMIYYFLAYRAVKSKLNGRKWVVSVPSGNFGNLTAGLFAQKMGLPIDFFVAGNNANDTFYQYTQTGEYTEKPSVATYSNAMDVGAPSNFERILALYNNSFDAITANIKSSSFTDEATLDEIKQVYKQYEYVLDPHTAVGLLALKDHLPANALGTVLSTAHPYKFESVVQKAIPDVKAPKVDLSQCKKIPMRNSYDAFRQLLFLKN